MRNPLRIFNLATLLCLCALPLKAEQVTIFAASSLKTALDQVIEMRELDVVAVYGGSAAIARQISQGAAADIVILAHPMWMDWLEKQDALKAGSRCNLLGNTLVLAGQKDAKHLQLPIAQSLIDALQGSRLAVGELRSVPAGQYAAEYLQDKGWLDALRPHLAQTSNVRLALALIARGETKYGFTYASDVYAEPRVRRVFTPETTDYPAIRYPLAVTKTAGDPAFKVARSLAQDVDIFAQSGFQAIPIDEDGRCQ